MPARRPLSTRTRRQGALLAAALLAAVPALTACGAGRGAETTKVVAAIDGANASVGDLSVRQLYVKDGRLSGYVYNDGTKADSLVSVQVAGGQVITVGTDLPAGRLTGLGADGPDVEVNLADAQVGTTVPVTLTFSNAGTLTEQPVPISLPDERSSRSPVPATQGE